MSLPGTGTPPGLAVFGAAGLGAELAILGGDCADDHDTAARHLLGLFVLHMAGAGRADRTIRDTLLTVGQFHRQTGVPPHLASHRQISAWFALNRAWAANSKLTRWVQLNSFFVFLAREDHRPDNPMLKVPRPRAPRGEPRPLSDPQVARLLAAPMRAKTRAMILLCLLAGLRVHEVAKLRGQDVDLDSGTLAVVGKGGRRAVLPLHPALADLAEAMPRRGPWFPANSRLPPGEPVRSRSVSEVIRRAMRRAEVPGTPHALRHWYATALVRGGADLRTVQTLMRHANLSTTAVYTAVADTTRAAAVGRLTIPGTEN